MSLSYFDIQDLPADDPKGKQFEAELALDDLMHEELAKGESPLADESSQAYFDRFIAGDR